MSCDDDTPVSDFLLDEINEARERIAAVLWPESTAEVTGSLNVLLSALISAYEVLAARSRTEAHHGP